MKNPGPANEQHANKRILPAAAGGFALALSVAVLLLATTISTPSPQEVSPNRRALASALGGIRLLHGRLTGGFAYLPLETKVQIIDGYVEGYEQIPELKPSQIRSAVPLAKRIAFDYDRHPSSLGLGDKALLSLLHHHGDIRVPILMLKKASEKEPHNASLWSDLAAAYLDCGWGDSHFLGIEAATHAVRENPSLPEARFNLALALEQSSMFHQAFRAWKEYLKVDSSSSWAKEALFHLQHLHQPSHETIWRQTWRKRLERLVTQKHIETPPIPPNLIQIARDDVLDNILPRWGYLLSKGQKAEAHRQLQFAHKISEALPSDSIVSEAVKAIDAAPIEGQELLAQAHIAYASGIQQLREGRLAQAQPQLQESASIFIEHSSPFEYLSNLALAQIGCQLSDFAATEAIIDRIRERADISRYLGLNQRLAWVESICDLKQGKPSDAQSALRAIEPTFSEDELGGITDLFLAKCAAPTGGHVPTDFYRALRKLSRFPESGYLEDLYQTLANAYSYDLPGLALQAFDESIEIATLRGNRSALIESLFGKSRLENRIGQRDAALRDLAEAEANWPNLDKEATKDGLSEQRMVTRCQVLDDPSLHCVKALTRAVQFYTSHDKRYLSDALRVRAEIHRRRGETSAETADLSEAITAQETSGGGNRHPRQDRSEQTRDLYDLLVSSKIASGSLDQAFEFEDRSRSTSPTPKSKYRRTWSPFFSFGCNMKKHSPKEFAHGLPESSVLVEYSIQGNKIVAWIFRHKTKMEIKFLLSPAELPTIIHNSHTMGNKRYSMTISKRSREFSRLMLKPLEPWLPTDREIFFLIDSSLGSTDFAALLQSGAQESLCNKDTSVVVFGKNKNHPLHGDTVKAAKLLQESASIHEVAAAPQNEQPNLSANSIRKDIPDHVALIEYKVFRDHVIVWVVTKNGLRAISIPVASQYIDLLISDWLDSLLRPSESKERTLSSTIYNILFRPISNLLLSSTELVVIPDGPITKISFPALYDDLSKRYLVERFSVCVTTSSSLYLQQLKNYPRPDHRRWTAFAISSPISSEQRHIPMPLPGAHSEVDYLLRLFPNSQTVSGRDANYRHSFPIREHAILHLAGHWDPLSRAYDGTFQPDSLPVNEHVKLVVLSVCNSLDGLFGRDSNGLGIPGELLNSWVPAVLASLWSVDDVATDLLLRHFYEQLRSGRDGANALRAAQLGLLHGNSKTLRLPRYWAGFQFMGFGGI